MAVLESNFIYDRFVDGKDYIIRRQEEETLSGLIGRCRNVAIYEAPKTGKTSLLRKTLFTMKTSGKAFGAAELSLLNIRDSKSLCARLVCALTDRFASTPNEKKALIGKYFEDSRVRFDQNDFAAGKSRYVNIESERVSEEDMRACLSYPYRLSADRGERIIVTLSEFQNILLFEDSAQLLRVFEDVARQGGGCSWIWTGSMVNAMKDIFEKEHYFARSVERVRIFPAKNSEIEEYIMKGFLVNGKVIERPLLRKVCSDLHYSLYHINHFAAICDGISRGYITDATAREAMRSLLAMHEPSFIFMMNGLTGFQVRLLKAILDGEYRFSSAEVIERYSLSSSANVKRIKDALCKKEIVTFEKDSDPAILDPLFEYWLKVRFFV